MERTSVVKRSTNETQIEISLNLDGKGIEEISTGVGFFDHMLTQICKHGFLDLKVLAKGDVEVDCHHTVEDVGIALGTALFEAVGDKKGICRYGSAYVPMDEALALCVVDISGRPFLKLDSPFSTPKIGDFDTEMVEEFFRALAFNAKITLHMRVLEGKNNHHICEAMFKAFGRALRAAVAIDPSLTGVMSTKGVL